MTSKRRHPKMTVIKATLREDGVLLLDGLPFKANQKVGVYVWSDRDFFEWPNGTVPSNYVPRDLFAGSNDAK